MFRCISAAIIMFTQATIKDVARAAGVHFTTVSMALRGHPAIAIRTRLRIEGVASLIGYQRNEVFSALSRQRRNHRQSQPIPTLLYLARVVADRHFFAMDHHRELVAGATREAKALGYQLNPCVVGPSGILPHRLQAHLTRSTAAGLVIGAWDPTLEVPTVDWNAIPTVRIDSRHVPAQVPFVSFDQMNCVLQSYRKLQALGYRRIGLALGEKDEDATDGLHLSGWVVAQTEFPRLEKIPPLLFPPRATFNQVLPLLEAWFRQHRTDAIMCNWTSIPLMLRALKGRIATDVGCVCLCLRTNQRRIAGILPNFDLVGQRAISLLGSIISAPPDKLSTSPLTCYVEGTWHDGPSIQPQN
jgi:LacI family transcriptional regulator